MFYWKGHAAPGHPEIHHQRALALKMEQIALKIPRRHFHFTFKNGNVFRLFIMDEV